MICISWGPGWHAPCREAPPAHPGRKHFANSAVSVTAFRDETLIRVIRILLWEFSTVRCRYARGMCKKCYPHPFRVQSLVFAPAFCFCDEIDPSVPYVIPESQAAGDKRPRPTVKRILELEENGSVRLTLGRRPFRLGQLCALELHFYLDELQSCCGFAIEHLLLQVDFGATRRELVVIEFCYQVSYSGLGRRPERPSPLMHAIKRELARQLEGSDRP